MTENTLVEHKVKHRNTRFLKDLEFLERQHDPDTNFSKMISEIKKPRKKY